MPALLNNEMSTAQKELSACDEDLRKHFGATEDHEECVYVPGLPIKIQIVRLFRELIHILKDNNNNINYCSSGDNNIKPK